MLNNALNFEDFYWKSLKKGMHFAASLLSFDQNILSRV